MIIIIISLASIMLLFQLLLSLILKRGISKKNYINFIALLIIDYLLTILFIISIEYNFDPIIQRTLLFLEHISTGLFFLLYMRIFKYKTRKTSLFVFSIVILGSFTSIIFVNHLNINIILLIFLLMALIIAPIIMPKFQYTSRYLTTLLTTFIIAEGLRYSVSLVIINEYLINNINNLWIACISLIIKTISVFVIIEFNDKKLLDPNLQTTLNRITPSNLLTTTFTEHPDAVVITDLNHKIIFANPNLLLNTGYTIDEVIGKRPGIFSSGLTDKSVYTDMFYNLKNNHIWQGEFINKRKNNEIFFEQAKIITIFDIHNKPAYYLAIKTDISNEKKYLERLEFLSKHDDLTSLYRRHHLSDLVVLHLNEKSNSESFFLLFDLDGFKSINDQFGHYTGDEALKLFSNILLKVFNNNSYVSRFGGDEFAVYIYDTNSELVKNQISELNKLLKLEFISLNNNKIYLSTSYGKVIVNKNLTFREIYELADQRLYESKKSS